MSEYYLVGCIWSLLDHLYVKNVYFQRLLKLNILNIHYYKYIYIDIFFGEAEHLVIHNTCLRFVLTSCNDIKMQNRLV